MRIFAPRCVGEKEEVEILFDEIIRRFTGDDIGICDHLWEFIRNLE